jgi:hypothetical protein
MKFYLLAFCMGFSVLLYSQDKVNQLDSAGKKHGAWIVYWNSNWQNVSDSNKASYCRYTYFEHGKDLQPIEPCEKGWTVVHTKGNDLQNGRIKLLDGLYAWTDSKDITRCIASFKNGRGIYYKWYYPSGAPQFTIEYREKWQNQPHTYLVSSYDKNGIITYSFWCKWKNGWEVVPKLKLLESK